MSARMAENRLTVFCVEEVGMLTDVALKNLKPREKAYKVTDRDGVYVQVSTSGTLRSEEQTSALQSLMRISYAVFCLKQKKSKHQSNSITKPTAPTTIKVTKINYTTPIIKI